MATPDAASCNPGREETAKGWTLTREAGHLQNMFALYNHFGTQSNLVCVATYNNSRGTASLQPENLYPALCRVIEEHYSLGVLAVEQPSPSKKNKHRLWEARLSSIDLEQAVEYTEDESVNTDAGMHELIQKIHNDWFEPDDFSSQRWKIRVINGRHVFFIYDHFIADGMSGYAFHRSLLRALNAGIATQAALVKTITPPPLDPPAQWFTDFPVKASLFWLIIGTLTMNFLRAFFTSWIIFSEAKIEGPQKFDERFNKSLRCKTAVYGLDIPAEQQRAITRACKALGVTYTAVLHTLTMSTLAVDVYPQKRIALSSLPISLRRFARTPQTADVMVNSVATMVQTFWSLSRFRKAARASTALHSPQEASDLPRVALDVAAVVALSKKYTQDLKSGLADYSLFNSSIAWAYIGDDVEDIFANAFGNLRLFQQHIVLLSNLGTFEASQHTRDVKEAWTLDDIQFSAAATKSTYGCAAPVFGIAGVAGGACHMNVVIEEGVLPDEMMRTFLGRLKERLLLFGEIAGDSEVKAVH